MNTTSIKTMALLATLLPCIALAHPPTPPRGVHIPVAPHIRHPMPPPPPRHHHSSWGRGGCNFWPGFIGGVVGSAITSTIPPPPPPIVAAHPVWIPPLYEQRAVYDAYGRLIRYERVVVRAGYWQY